MNTTLHKHTATIEVESSNVHINLSIRNCWYGDRQYRNSYTRNYSRTFK